MNINNVSRAFAFLLLLFLSIVLTGCLHTTGKNGPPGNSKRIHPVSQVAAGIVGTAAAQIVWRKGRLSEDRRAVDQLIQSLRPLDIVIAKNGHRLTDKILPGYFAHAMVWIGRENELRRRGLWNRAELRPLHKAIRQGRTVIDVDYKGVRLVHHDGLMDSDDLVVLRSKSASDNRAAIRRFVTIVNSLDKNYDFGFDIDTPAQVTCTELTARLYPEIPWTYREFLGRRQLVPDDMVNLALNSKQIDVILYLTKLAGNKPARLLSNATLSAKLVNSRH
jgi:hypothetical protein